MCGILCLFQPASTCTFYRELFNELKPCIDDRGPDLIQDLEIHLASGDTLSMHSSVLSLRPPLTGQPLTYEKIDGNHDLLQFNGELYNDDINGNDTSYLYNQIEKRDDKLENVLEEIKGELAFCFYQAEKNVLWFGRDCIGRRSLMYSHSSTTGELIIASATDSRISERNDINLIEVPGGVLFKYHLDSKSLETIKWSYDTSVARLTFPYKQINSIYEDSRSPEEVSDFTQQLYKKLQQATKRRVIGIPQLPSNDTKDSKLAILFSGGIDCTLIAAFADEILPINETIDLLNVAFDNPRIGGGYNTPDRKLGKRSWAELCKLHQKRYSTTHCTRFRFVEINIPYEETLEHRPNVQGLIKPQESVMDLSIAIAFYFASRGKGSMYSDPDDLTSYTQENYTSHARVLLSGLGADELYGGYTRHTREFTERGADSFAEELQLDFSRLHSRNLGRDDRACSTWGKELRYPFLDEDVVSWTMSNCPLDLKMSKRGDTIEGKSILRNIARNLGLSQVAEEKKRAIQFGAKSAKMELGSGKVKGTDVFR